MTEAEHGLEATTERITRTSDVHLSRRIRNPTSYWGIDVTTPYCQCMAWFAVWSAFCNDVKWAISGFLPPIM